MRLLLGSPIYKEGFEWESGRADMRLYMTHDELAPIVFGSNLRRAARERPIQAVTMVEAKALGRLADKLTSIRQEMDWASGLYLKDAEAREWRVGVSTFTKLSVATMGNWAFRAMDHYDAVGAYNEAEHAAWVGHDLDMLAQDRRTHIAYLGAVCILPTHRDFWPEVLQ